MTMTEWSKVFPNWVSYKVNIDALLLGDDDEDLWADIAKAIVAVAIRSQNVSSLKKRIYLIYYAKMADVADHTTPEGLVHAMHFQAAMDGLVSSEDV